MSLLHDARRRVSTESLLVALICVGVLVLAAFMGKQASLLRLGLLAASLGGLILLAQPVLGLLALLVAALVLPLEIVTGTEVKLNPVAILIPSLLGLWMLDMVRRRNVRMVRSPTTLPLVLFLLAGLFSLLIGRVTWDSLVPVSDNFLLVQLAQWAIFAFSAGAFWLTANLVKDEAWLWRLTAAFLLLAGGVAILLAMPGLGNLVSRFTTVAFARAPFWILLVALAGGQLLFNRTLSLAWRLFLLATLGAALLYAFIQQQDATSNWVGLVAVLGTLAWLRFPRLRWPAMALIAVLIAVGVLFPAVYNFAGGDAEWQLSGVSRLLLSQRVIDVSMRNPITGLGPAAYRRYAAMEPLQYGRAFWVLPQVNSHNNYVDLFSQVGLVGLAFFLWFAIEAARLGYRLHNRYTTGFKAAYANGVLAAGVGALVLMVFADWILPFVYNIGFPGFQASVLVWVFLGGLVALEGMEKTERETP